MTAAHTPAPWVMEESKDGFEILMGTALVDRTLFEVQHSIAYEIWGIEPDEDEDDAAQFAEARANAHLIAAAPDLYEALIGFFAMPFSAEFRDLFDKAQAAINKAEGRAA